MTTASHAPTEERAARPYESFITERVTKEAIVVVGPMSHHSEVLRALYEDGWRCLQTGPYSDTKLWPKVDPKRFKFHAERAIDNG